MDGMSATVKRQYLLVYLNDIYIFSETPEKHIKHLKHMLTLLQKAGITLTLKSVDLSPTGSVGFDTHSKHAGLKLHFVPQMR